MLEAGTTDGTVRHLVLFWVPVVTPVELRGRGGLISRVAEGLVWCQ